ncbi:MAG: protein kinase [Phycisphaerales bacterium]
MSLAPEADECLSPEEVEVVAAHEPVTQRVWQHALSCPICRRAIAEASINQRFLRELIGDEGPSEIGATVRTPTNPPPAASELLRGLADYELLNEIHRGAQGVVHRAVHRPSGRVAAVKIMHLGSLRQRVRMQREASLAAALRHPGIVTLHDCGELSDGRYAIAMELVDGEMLDEWANRLRGFDASRPAVLRRIATVMAAICDAVQHAHTRGVIHRDLKPSNIIVDAEDQPHVLDFGVARRAADDFTDERVTLTGEVACTLGYAAPEQLSGSPAHVDTRSDLYALGVVLYELVTGKPPYPTDGPVAEVVGHIRNAIPAAPRSVASGVDVDLETIILKSLAKEAERRYQSAAAMRADLLHWLSGEAIDARRDSRIYVLRKAIRRNRGSLAVAASILLTIVCGAVFAGVSAARSAAARELAAMDQRRARDEARRWEAVAELLHELIPSMDPQFTAYGFGPMHQAVEQLTDRLDAGLFAEDPPTQAAIHTAMGDVCAERGSPRLAEVQFRQALRITLMQPDAPAESVAAAQRRLADLLISRNGFDEAERLANAAVRTLRSCGPTATAELIEGLRTMARIALARNDLRRAESLCREALEARASLGGNAEEWRSPLRQTIARVFLARGMAAEAEREARESLRATLASVSDFHPHVADALETLADCVAQRDADESRQIAHLARALRLRTTGIADLDLLLRVKSELLGPDHPDLVETLAERVGYWRQRDAVAEARQAAEEALPLARKLRGPTSMVVADLLETHYICAYKQHDFDAAVRSLLERMAILRRLLPGKDDLHLAVALREAASFAGSMERFDLADALWNETIAYAESHLGPSHRELAWALGLHAYSLFWVRGEREPALRQLDRAIDMLERIDSSPSFHLALMNAVRAQFLSALDEPEEAACSLERLNEMCAAAPEAGIQRGSFFEMIDEQVTFDADPTCCALLWKLRDEPRNAPTVVAGDAP